MCGAKSSVREWRRETRNQGGAVGGDESDFVKGIEETISPGSNIKVGSPNPISNGRKKGKPQEGNRTRRENGVKNG